MKLIIQYLSLTTVLASSALATSSTTSRQALLYTIDVKHGASNVQASPSGLTEVSSEEAQMIVDRRLGTNLKGEIGKDAREDVLETLSNFGGTQRPMFDVYKPEQPLRVGVIMEGWEFDGLKDHERFSPSAPSLGIKSFEIEDVWDAVTVKQGKECSYSKATLSGLKWDAELTECGFKDGCAKSGDVQMVDQNDEELIEREFNWIPNYLCRIGHGLVRLSFPKDSNERMIKAFNQIHKILAKDAENGDRESTILILPASSSTLNRRQIPQEEPLTASSTDTHPSKQSSAPTIAPSNSTLPSALAIPRCFVSLNSCNAGTNNCSSHGSCIQVHTPNAGDDKSDKGCWSCSCKSTPNGKGGVISWGGNACQKKDISIPFWLFAGFGVTMAAVVVGGVGMLYSMGSEDLPGVLGAGVGGPRSNR